MNNKIKYEVNSIINVKNESKEELVKIFNEKLLRIIITMEKNAKEAKCLN